MFQITTAMEKIMAMTKRIRAVIGGTSASKTVSILCILISLAQTDEKPTLTSVVAESVPHLKRGAMRDFKNIMQKQGYWRDSSWNATDRVYTFETGSQIEFFPTGEGKELKGGRRDRLFMNEANNQTFQAYNQLESRTKEFVFLDWNPDTEFWYYEELKGKPEVEEITVTYKDNEALDEGIVFSIESRKDKRQWWRVYGLGLLGESESRVYRGWDTTTMQEVPYEARYVRTGLDFGYTNDPSAAVDIYYYNGAYILDEVLYRTGMSNKMIFDVLTQDGSTRNVLGDSAEPKSIAELKLLGLLIDAAQKGAGSVSQGIQFVRDQKIYVTTRSLNLIKEYRNYKYKDNGAGGYTNEPEGGDDHALDAVRYGFSGDIAKHLPNDRIKRQIHTMLNGNTSRL